jgi:glycosyltransferase involved in cell wall biosynthesis
MNAGRGTRRVIVPTLLRENGVTGVHSHMTSFAQHAERIGIPVDVVTPFSSPRSIVRLPIFALRRIIDPVSGGISVWWYHFWHIRFLARALERQLVNDDAVVLYAQDPGAARAALSARRSARQRVVLMVHFNVSQAEQWVGLGRIRRGSWAYRWLERSDKQVFAALDAVVYPSQFMRTVLEERYPQIRRVHAAVIPYSLPDVTPLSTREEMLGDLVTVGHLEPRKGQAYLLRIVAEAAQQGYRFTVTVAGDGPDRRSLEALATKLGIASQVKFVGVHKDVPSLLDKHRLLCHTARIDNLPFVILEALRAGLPVAAIPVGGIPEMFSDHVEGVYLPSHDPTSSAESIAAILRSPDSQARMARASRLRFERRYSEGVGGRRLMSFLSDVMSPVAGLRVVD